MKEILFDALASGRGEHILFVDDEPAICALAQTFLERLGYRVTAHTDPEEALAQFHEAPDQFALVLTNLIMPRMTGVQLAKRISQVRPRLPIVMVTGFSGAWTLAKLREFGIRDLISKPMTLAMLAAAVRRALLAAANEGSTHD